MWTYALSSKVGTEDYPGWVVKAKVNRVWERALIDRACSKSLIRNMQDDKMPEQMYIKCVH